VDTLSGWLNVTMTSAETGTNERLPLLLVLSSGPV
jgi:hypothetical protein